MKEPTPAADQIGHEHEEKIDISEQVEKALRGSGKADGELIKKVKEKVKKKEKVSKEKSVTVTHLLGNQQHKLVVHE